MRVLLDTHTLLRMLMGDDRLSPHARSLLLEPTNERWVLPISLVEIALKIRIGKLTLKKSFSDLFPSQLVLNDIVLLPIEAQHVELLTTLPIHHRDPFDRLIAATALSEGLTLASADVVFGAYGVTRCW